MVVRIKGNLLTIGKGGYLGLNEIIHSAQTAFTERLSRAGAGCPTNSPFESTVIIPWKEQKKGRGAEKQHIQMFSALQAPREGANPAWNSPHDATTYELAKSSFEVTFKPLIAPRQFGQE